MSDIKIAKTVAEAQVGEWLWRLDPDASVYEAGKYIGRGAWKLVEVTEVLRLSLMTREQKYDRKTGRTRPRISYGYGGPSVWGSDERSVAWWEGQTASLGEKLRFCRDVETLKAVAFVLGFEGPPDFTVSPEAQEDRSDG